MTINEFLTKRYDDIITMSKKICKGSVESEEVAHYIMSEFIERPDAQALIDRNEAMKFMSGMIWRSFHSSTSPYHTIYRQKGRVHPKQDQSYYELDQEDYDFEKDLVIDQTERILNNMAFQGIHKWYISTLFKMYIKESNYSELSRQTGIPRTSISHAVEECKKYLQEELKNSGITWKQ